MESIDDSGFDSDPKPQHTEINGLQSQEEIESLRKTAELAKKLEKKREAARKAKESVSFKQPSAILSRSRLIIPGRGETSKNSPDAQPLVLLESDDSEDDEFAVPRLTREAHKEITQQLIKDGYNLDLDPDDEELDLIPPRPVSERCICCNTQVNCTIQ